MNKLILDFDNDQTIFEADGTMTTLLFTEKLGCALRQAMGEDRRIANGVLAAACDYAAKKGINLTEMMKDFFPGGYRPSKL